MKLIREVKLKNIKYPTSISITYKGDHAYLKVKGTQYTRTRILRRIKETPIIYNIKITLLDNFRRVKIIETKPFTIIYKLIRTKF